MNDSSTTIVRSAENGSICEAVILAVSEATETDPMELDPLYGFVDPDALDRLFQTRSGREVPEGRVTFTMEGCGVTVHANGKVVAAPEGKPVDARLS